MQKRNNNQQPQTSDTIFDWVIFRKCTIRKRLAKEIPQLTGFSHPLFCFSGCMIFYKFTKGTSQDCSGKQSQVWTLFLDFWPNPGPGRLPLASGRGDVEFAGVLASVASLAVSSVPEFIFWSLVKEVEKYTQARLGLAQCNHTLVFQDMVHSE